MNASENSIAAGAETPIASVPALKALPEASMATCHAEIMSAESPALASMALNPFLPPDTCTGTRKKGMKAAVQ
jgi:hypothetical protein